ncbi:MAG: fibronectin type III domain-containing protein [Nitrospira sp.]|nr:fibronectin type III domain-containing protein [Nitrospira sp.]
MLKNALSLGLVHRNFSTAIAQMIVLSLIALPLAGCGDDGQGGPMISSLSTPAEPTDTQPGGGAPSDSEEPPAEENPEATSTTEDVTASAIEEFDPAAIAESVDGEEEPAISVTSTPTGATARLNWDPNPDPKVAGYAVYYGRQSSGNPGSCSYEESQSVESPPAIITGLDPNTPYFFAISAYGDEGGDSESPCSNEVLVVTPPAQG